MVKQMQKLFQNRLNIIALARKRLKGVCYQLIKSSRLLKGADGSVG